MPDRFQRRRTPGWRMPKGAVYVGRPTVWGNPFEIGLIGRDLAVSMFADLMRGFFSPFPLAHLTDEHFGYRERERAFWAGYALGRRQAARQVAHAFGLLDPAKATETRGG